MFWSWKKFTIGSFLYVSHCTRRQADAATVSVAWDFCQQQIATVNAS